MKIMRFNHPRFFFSKREKRYIQEAIRKTEQAISGEIRIHLMSAFKKEPLQEGKEIFERLQMTQTRERNGVLILFAVKSRQFCILGDKGIHEKVPADFWQHLTEEMSYWFKQDRFADGLITGIREIGEHLKHYFPHRPDDMNELSDSISYSS
jgi:uncharacterized membrane protein